jgi:membrane-anchored glycerophosphoryl diester phosphodiesterase (GDPDase)
MSVLVMCAPIFCLDVRQMFRESMARVHDVGCIRTYIIFFLVLYVSLYIPILNLVKLTCYFHLLEGLQGKSLNWVSYDES